MSLKKYLLLSFLIILSSCKSENKNKKIYDTENVTQIIHDDVADSLFGIGENLFRNSEYESARNYLNKALQKESNTIIYNELGLLEFELDNKLKSIYYHKEGIRIDSTYYSNYINLSKIYLDLKEFDKAKALLNKVIANKNSSYWKAVGNLYLASVLINDEGDCNIIKKHITEAKTLQNDEDFDDFYQLVITKFSNNCN